MTDIKSTVLKDILSKKLTKAKDGISQILKDKSFKAIEDYKKSFQFVLPSDDAPVSTEVSVADVITPEDTPDK
jgi:hypothetical protein|tara:strand:+ start:191 stop:409 length:219 start_codon:yes stop_codon:yes gene_type:complete